MAQRMKKTEVSTTTPSNKKQPTANEMREWYEKNKKHIENFAAAESAAKTLRDVTKNGAKVVNTFSKESLRSYLQNISSNEKNLRNLSRYLFYRCHAYYRWIMYQATMYDLNCRSVIPQYDVVKGGDAKKMLSSYYSTLSVLDQMNIQFEFLKALTIAFREDVFFGCAYYTEGQGLYILPLDPDYAVISGAYSDGSFAFSYDMSYFRSRAYELEAWGEPWSGMWSTYQSTGVKYQPMPDEYSVCLKSRPEDWQTVLPIASGLLNSIISLVDSEDLQAISEEIDIYKMIFLEMETLTGADQADEWKVDPSIMVDYFNRMIEEALPPYISAAIVPGKLDSISFNNNAVTETNKVTNATEALYATGGFGQILNSNKISGTTAFTAAITADTEIAISAMLPQIQGIVNRLLSFYVSGDAARVKFFEVSVYTKEAFKKSLMEGAERGLPTILAYNSCNQFSELESLALNFLENDVLDLKNKFIPVSTSHTQSGSDTGGAPTKDNDEISDSGEASKEKKDKANG